MPIMNVSFFLFFLLGVKSKFLHDIDGSFRIPEAKISDWRSWSHYLKIFFFNHVLQLRCTYRAYDAMDEITAAFSISFNPAGTK